MNFLMAAEIVRSLTETSTDTETNIADNVKGEAAEMADFITKILDRLKGMIPSIIFALIVFAIGIFLSKMVVTILLKGMKRANVDNTARGFMRSLVKIALYTIVSVITLSLLNVPMNSIVAVIGAAGLAIGLALQSSLSNLAGGFIILFSQPFKAGDYIETKDSSGTVESISILYTKLVTPDNKTVYIPNGIISGGMLVNYTQKPKRRLDMEFPIGYDNDIVKVKDILNGIIDKHEKSLKDPEPLVKVGRHDESSVVVFVRIWVMTDDYWDLYFDMIELVKTEFDNNDISIPYNQLDIHMR